MSQHWIKVRESLHSDSRVITMAGMLATTSASYVLSASARDLLGVTPTVTRDVMIDVTVSSLIRVWIAGNQHTVDGVFHHATLDHLDTLSHVPGFGAAMAAVGYAIADPETRTVTLPNFRDHNAPTKAARGNSASERQKRWRDKKRRLGDVTRDVTETPTETADKIRLDKNISEQQQQSAPASNSPSTANREQRTENSSPALDRGIDINTARTWAETYNRSNAEGITIPMPVITAWHDARSTTGWNTVRDGTEFPIRDWQADLRQYARKWQQNERSPQPRNSSRPPAAPVILTTAKKGSF